MQRRKLARLGVAAAVVGSAVAGIAVYQAGALPATPPSSLIAITPCRLVDTRAAAPVGGRNTPIGNQETATFTVWGTNGNCNIPNTALGIVTNTTIVNPTSASFLTLWPADDPQPLASNLNWTPTSPPTPNQVSVGLSADGKVKLFNNSGTVDVIIDIVGGPEVPAFIDRLAPNGRLVLVGAIAGMPPADFGMRIMQSFQKSRSVATFSLDTVPTAERDAARARFFAEAARGQLHPVVHDVLPLERAADAHREMDAGRVFGRIVLVP